MFKVMHGNNLIDRFETREMAELYIRDWPNEDLRIAGPPPLTNMEKIENAAYLEDSLRHCRGD